MSGDDDRSSTMTARPIVSAFRFMPGRSSSVMAIAPPNAAPSEAPIAAISSSLGTC